MKSLVFTLLLMPLFSWAASDSQTWNSLSAQSQTGRFKFGFELENRTSAASSAENINQIKPSLFYNLKKGSVGFIYTFESDGSFKVKAENRYSVAYDFIFYETVHLRVKTRLRQEFRNFSDQNELAYRFRLRNTVESKKVWFLGFKPSVSSEWRVYEKDSAGKSINNFSHRSILKLTRAFKSFDLAVHYTHNYQKEDASDENTHAIGVGLSLRI